MRNQSLDVRPIKFSDLKNNWSEYQPIVEDGLGKGGKFKKYSFTVSVVVMTFTNPVIYYIPPGGNSSGLSTIPNLTTAILGWWGFPWGPINSIKSLIENSGGGKDITRDMAKSLGMKTMGEVAREKIKDRMRVQNAAGSKK